MLASTKTIERAPWKARLQDWWEGHERTAEGAESEWKARLQAWWQGTDWGPPAHDPEPALEAAAAAGDDESGLVEPGPIGNRSIDEGWPASRIALNEQVWGEGFNAPGGKDVISEMVAPLGLSKEHTVVDLGAGLGGAARVIAKTTGAWVSGYEQDAELAEAAMEKSTMAGMAQKAPVKRGELAAVKIRKRTVDCVFSKEQLFTVEDKGKLFGAVHTMLKVEGHLLFTDLFAAGPHAADPTTEVWAAHEPRRPTLWTVEDTGEMLTKLGFEVRITEDITETYRARVITGFDKLLRHMQDAALKPDLASWVLAETEHWARRVAALDGGDVKVYRVYARIPFPV